MALDNLDDIDDQDEENQMPEEDSDAPAISDAPPEGPSDPMWKTYLKNKAALQQAQNQAQSNRTGIGLASALTQIGHGISGAAGSADLSGLNNAAQNTEAPVKNLLQQQAGQNKLLAIKSYLEQKKQAAADKLAAASQHTQERVEDRKDKQGEKFDKDHEAYVTKVEDRARGWRGDPATTRFDQNLAAVSTADAILQKYRGREDEMPLQDIHALVADKLKAMTGGAPTEQEIKAQMPNTLSTKWSGTKSFFSGSPEPANAGDFVKSIDGYFKDMEKKSLSGVKNRQKSIVNSPRLSQEERDRIAEMGVPQAVYQDQPQAASGPHGPSVQQNGHTYNWNPATGKYE